MIPVSTLYDEYMDRRKLTEQKKPFEYIVPPPQEGSEQKKTLICSYSIVGVGRGGWLFIEASFTSKYRESALK